MRELIERIDRLCAKRALPWTRRGRRVRVTLGEAGRRQELRIEREGEEYLFTSVVLRYDEMRAHGGSTEIACRAWRKNALKQLVAFSFDDDDNLIGAVRHPVATLDDDELLLSIEVLAQEADRFEYKLTGKDRE